MEANQIGVKTMANFPTITISEMLESGVHYGHKSMLWNPKMSQYIYCVRNGIHIIDLQQTAVLLHNTLKMVYQAIKNNPKTKILFVGTKHQASQHIKKFAEDSGQYYVDHRWLGGMLTNWNTVVQSIRKLSEYEKILSEENSEESVKYSKKELLDIDRNREKLERSLGGIRNLKGKPDFMFIIDTNKEKIAVTEAKKLGIPVIAVVDTNSNPDNIDYVICGNDDSSKAIEFYCNIMSKAVLAALEDALVAMGVDPAEAAEKVRAAIERDKLAIKPKAKSEKPTQSEDVSINNKRRPLDNAPDSIASSTKDLKEIAEELSKNNIKVKIESKQKVAKEQVVQAIQEVAEPVKKEVKANNANTTDISEVAVSKKSTAKDTSKKEGATSSTKETASTTSEVTKPAAKKPAK